MVGSYSAEGYKSTREKLLFEVGVGGAGAARIVIKTSGYLGRRGAWGLKSGFLACKSSDPLLAARSDVGVL